MQGEGVMGGGLPGGAKTMTQLSDGVWGWAGAESVNAKLSSVSRDLENKHGKPRETPASEIVDGIWLGTNEAASDLEFLKKLNVQSSFQVGGSKLEETEVMRFVIKLENEETDSLLVEFPKAFKNMRTSLEDGPILIHCASGLGSRALCTGFLMAQKGMTYQDATSKIQEVRESAPELNRNLSRQLNTWAKWPEFPGLPDWM